MAVTRAEPGERPQAPLRIVGVLASGCILQPINSSMVAIAIVAFATHFGASTNVSWVISAMYIATAVGAPMAGRLGAVIGARRVYLGGLVVTSVGSLVGMFAPSLTWLVVAYALIGIGISGQAPNAMTLIRVYGERYRTSSRRAVTALAICGQSVAALGPTVGGLLVGAFGWQSVLWVNLPVAAISALVVSLHSFPSLAADPNQAARKSSFDVVGVVLFVAAIVSLMLFLISMREAPLWWMLAPVVGALVAFIAWERRAADPFVDVRTLAANRPLSAALTRTVLAQTCTYAVFFGIPQWLQYARGMSATQAGLTMLPVAAVSVLFTVIGSYTYRRYGARWTLFWGSVSLLAGGVLIALVERNTAPILVLLLVAGVLGIPNGFNNIGTQNLINAVTSSDEVGTAIGMYRTVQFIGANLAVVVLLLAAGRNIEDNGLHRIGWFIAAAAFILTVSVACARRSMPSRPVAPTHSLPPITAENPQVSDPALAQTDIRDRAP